MDINGVMRIITEQISYKKKGKKFSINIYIYIFNYTNIYIGEI